MSPVTVPNMLGHLLALIKKQPQATVKAHLENITFDEDQVPNFLKCDNGLEFKNQLIKEWASSIGIEILYGRRYTPTDQGAVEAYNKTILRDLRCYKTSHPD